MDVVAEVSKDVGLGHSHARAPLPGDLLDVALGQTVVAGATEDSAQVETGLHLAEGGLAHRPDGEDEGQAGLLTPDLGEVVGAQAAGVCHEGGVADEQRGVAELQHGLKNRSHGRELAVAAEEFGQQDLGQADGCARAGVHGDSADFFQRLSGDEQDGPHLVERGDGDIRQHDQAGNGGRGDDGNNANVSGAFAQGLRAESGDRVINVEVLDELRGGVVFEIPHERGGVEK